MPTVTVYASTDASAPVLTGEAGKLNDLLLACLVNGYGSKSAAGWTRPYNSGSNYASFRQGGGLQHYLAVNDVADQMARVTGFVTMSDFVTGTNPFPTDAQFSGGLYMRKSITANATARPWVLVATDRAFHLIVFSGATAATGYGGSDSHMSFGQLAPSFLSGDGFDSYLIAGTDTSTTGTGATSGRQVLTNLNAIPLPGHFMARGHAQTGGSITMGKRAANLFNQFTSGVGGAAYPDPIGGGLDISRIGVLLSGPIDRGWLPGLWAIGHANAPASFSQLDTFSGTGALNGRTWLIVLTASGGLAIETTDGSW
jgi:hypothetical protein